MAGICDICGKATGLKSFRCVDGKICGNCYQIVSNHFTSTITKSTLAELKKLYEENSRPLELGEDGFHISYKIGTFLLLDEKNRKFCILSNWAVTGAYARPEIFPYDALEEYEFLCEPEMTMEQFLAMASQRRSKMIIQKLWIHLKIKGTTGKDIVLLPGAVKVSGPAFRQACKYVKEIEQCMNHLRENSAEKAKDF